MTRAAFARAAFVLAAPFALFATTGCASQALRAPSLSIAGVLTSSESGALTEVDVTLPATGFSPNVDFFITRDDATGAFWRTRARTPQNDGSVRVALVPNGDETYAAGDSIAVHALDRGTGATVATLPYTVSRAPGSPILNGSFTAWPHGADTPTGWLESDGSSGTLYRRTERGRPAVELHLTVARPDAWNALEIGQDVSLARARFRIDVRPAASCDGFRRWPRELSGVALYDRRGYVITYCISERVARPTVLRTSQGKQAIVVLPGRRGVWRTVDVDPARDARDVPLGADGGPVRIGLGLRANPAGPEDANRDRSIAFANLRAE